MALTLEELKERLAMLDEVTIMEVLDIKSDDIVEKFEDKIADKYEELSTDYDEDEV
jgi:hypothetical protein